MSVWDLRKSSEEPKLKLFEHTGSVKSLQWDRTKLISGSDDHTVKIWDMNTGECVYTGYYHEESVLKIGFYENILYTIGEDERFYSWAQEKDSFIY